MFSALKRLTSRTENGNGSTGQPGVTGITTMSSSLQKKFSKGVQYNMKIIIKGDKNVGKSQLFRRLQGLPFVEEYTQTEEIQAASIQWNYKNSDDVIKVDVWEIVDKASKKKSLPNKLKIENSQSQGGGEEDGVNEIGLDASFLDVYKNTNGVIFVLDITKSWTFDYIKREINTVPLHIPVLILGNHRDMGHHRAVATDSVHYFIESLERNNIRYAESSMRNGFGLKYIHKFFNLPFLQLQRETLLKQLETNKEENQVTLTELDYYAESDDSNYDLFIENLSQKRRQVADALAPTTSKLSMVEAQAIAAEKAMKEGNVAAAVALASKPSIIDPKENLKTKTNVPTITSALQESAASNLSSTSSIVAGMQGASSIQNDESSKVQKEVNNKISSSVGTKSRNDNGNSQQQSSQVNNNNSNNSTASNTNNNSTNITPIDDFVPDESNGIDKSFFLEESSTPSRGGGNNNNNSNRNNKINKIPAREFETSEEEDGGETERVQGNPLVASYEEDFVPETYNSPIFTPTTITAASTIPSVEPTTINDSSDNTINVKKSVDNASKFCILSSSDEEEQEEVQEVDNKKTLGGGSETLDFKLNLNLSDLPQSNMDLDLGIFLKDVDNNDKNFNANDALSEFTSPSSTSNTKHSAKDKDKKSSKKSSSSSSSTSKHHKKSSKHKSKSSSKKERNALDDFLNGSDSPNNNPHDVDLNAYEAL